jgi:hypothetical protein
MRNDWIIAFVKLLVVLLLFFIPILVVRNFAAAKRHSTTSLHHPGKHMAKERFYFIGSSRIRHAINDSLLNSRFSSIDFLNTGMDNCTFIFNKVLADKLLNTNGPKTLFIEISVINARLPVGHEFILKNKEIISSVTPLMKKAGINDIRKIFWPLIESLSLSRVRLGPGIKGLLKMTTVDGQVGFLGSSDSTPKVSPWFFNEKDTALSGETEVHPLYGEIIHRLIGEAKQTGSKIIFIISPATRTASEKEVLTAVFNAIPRENKLLYDQDFLNKLNDKTLFRDEIHLNTAGSILFTNYLSEQAIRRNWIR